MIVECGHCGAPLDISKQKRMLMKCNYCGVENESKRLRIMKELENVSFSPPKEWTPPPHVSASSDKPLKYKKDSMGLLGFVVIFVPILTPFIILGGEAIWPYVHGATPEVIAAEPLDRSPQQVSSDLPSTTGSGTYVSSRFRRGAAKSYESASFHWTDESKGLVLYSFDIKAKRNAVLEPGLVDRLSANLHGGLDKSGNWRWGPVSLRLDLKDGDLSVSVDERYQNQPNPSRARQIEIGRQIILNAAFGLPLKATRDELVDVFGLGYPCAKLAVFDPATPLESANAALRRSFPGVIAQSPTSYVIAIDHPLFFSVDFSWANAANGALTSVSFNETLAYASGRSRLVSCLTNELGAPKETVTDYAKGKKDYEFTFGVGAATGANTNTNAINLGELVELDLNETSVSFRTVRGRARFSQANWARLWNALGKCR